MFKLSLVILIAALVASPTIAKHAKHARHSSHPDWCLPDELTVDFQGTWIGAAEGSPLLNSSGVVYGTMYSFNNATTNLVKIVATFPPAQPVTDDPNELWTGVVSSLWSKGKPYIIRIASTMPNGTMRCTQETLPATTPFAGFCSNTHFVHLTYNRTVGMGVGDVEMWREVETESDPWPGSVLEITMQRKESGAAFGVPLSHTLYRPNWRSEVYNHAILNPKLSVDLSVFDSPSASQCTDLTALKQAKQPLPDFHPRVPPGSKRSSCPVLAMRHG